MNFKKTLLAAAATTVLGLGAAHADTFAIGSLPTAQLVNPGSFSTTLYSSAADSAASLNFVLDGFRTLDGSSISANWDDKFTLTVNNAVIGTGFFKLGGGGDSSWSGTGSWACPTCTQPQNDVGGSVTFSNVVLNLLAGVNTIMFAYSAPDAPAGEGFSNEAWGVRSASVTSSAMVSAVPEPETYAMMLAGLGLIGSIARRRKVRSA